MAEGQDLDTVLVLLAKPVPGFDLGVSLAHTFPAVPQEDGCVVYVDPNHQVAVVDVTEQLRRTDPGLFDRATRDFGGLFARKPVCAFRVTYDPSHDESFETMEGIVEELGKRYPMTVHEPDFP